MKGSYLRTFLTAAFICFCLFTTSAQPNFNRVYDNDSLYDGGNSILQTLDGGYIITAATFNLGGYYAIYLLKLDQNGDTSWTKEYDFFPGFEIIWSVIQQQDSSYVMCGAIFDSAEGSTDTYLMKLDSRGDTLWTRIVDAGINDRGIMIREAPGGGFLVVGYLYENTGLDSAQAYLFKTDSLGTKIWQQEYGGPRYDFAYSVDFASDGGFILGGETNSYGAGGMDLCLYKTDSLGNLEWHREFGGPMNDRQGYAITTSDNGYALVGRKEYSFSHDKAYFIKTDFEGNLEWDKEFSRGAGFDMFRRVVQLPDKSYVCSGNTYDYTVPSTRPRLMLMKLCENGDSLWSQVYTHYGGDTTDDYLYDFSMVNDGGFIMSGYVINNYLPSKNDVLVVKTDSVGCLTPGCYLGPNTCASYKEWAPIGAQWHYTKHLLNGEQSFRLYASVKDTFFHGRTCRLFNTGDIMYRQSSRVFHWNSESQQFYQLHDFSAPVGSSWTIMTTDPNQDSVVSLIVTVDSIGSITINGDLLRTQFISISDSNWSYSGRVIEGIGWEGFMFPYEVNQTPAWGGLLRCYQDADLGLYETGIVDSCELVSGISKYIPDEMKIHFYPNPFSYTATISLEGYSGNFDLSLYDVYGKRVRHIGNLKDGAQIDRGMLSGGIYFYEIADGKNVLGRGKIIVD